MGPIPRSTRTSAAAPCNHTPAGTAVAAGNPCASKLTRTPDSTSPVPPVASATLPVGLICQERSGAQTIVPTPLIQSDAWLTGISCASPEFCMATGAAGQTRTAAALMFNGTTWIPLIVKHAPMWSGLFGVSCPTTNWCVGVGWWSDGVDQRLFTATWNGRQWKAWPSTGSSSRKGSWGEVSCPSRASCVAVGTSGNGNQRATIGILGSNDWTVGSLAKHGTTSGLGSVSCSSSKKCAAAGYSYGATGTHPMIVRRTAHGWVDAIDANSYASNRAFSAACPTTNWCTAGITQDTHHKPIVLAGSP